eukprot:Gb_38470 [translate_table: standard]
MLGKFPYRKLWELSKIYGPIMFLRLGSVPTVVASSPEMAKEFLKTHDLIFASRPSTCVGKYMAYNSTDVAFSPYGIYWRQMRKMCLRKLLSAKRIEFMKFIREEEIAIMRESVMKQCGVNGSNPVNISKLVSTVTMDIICRMTFGRKYSEESLKDGRGSRPFISAVSSILETLFHTWSGWIFNIGRRQKHIHKTFNDLLEKIIQEHVENKSRGHRDFVDVMLELSEYNTMDIKITRDNIKAVILYMLGAGTDPSSANLEWAMSEMLLNPSLMKKVHDELESIVGLNRMVEESDLPQLEKARIIVNAFVLGTDPNSWEDAEKFKPERFIGSPIDVKGQNFEVIPFGSGRRGCPGQQLATTVVEYALATLLHCFDWRLPNGMKAVDLSMTEKFGLSISRAVHVVAVPTPRLSQP